VLRVVQPVEQAVGDLAQDGGDAVRGGGGAVAVAAHGGAVEDVHALIHWGDVRFPARDAKA
jgi:hypothetical protein